MTSPTVERYDWLAILCLLFTVYGVVYVRQMEDAEFVFEIVIHCKGSWIKMC